MSTTNHSDDQLVHVDPYDRVRNGREEHVREHHRPWPKRRTR